MVLLVFGVILDDNTFVSSKFLSSHCPIDLFAPICPLFAQTTIICAQTSSSFCNVEVTDKSYLKVPRLTTDFHTRKKLIMQFHKISL